MQELPINAYVGPFKVLAKVGKVAYRLELPQELSRVHHTFHVSNLKKCYADEPLVMPLEGIHVDDKLQFVEEPVEIMEREIKRLKRSRIPLVKVRWNSRRGPEFTWEREDSFKQKYPQLFTNRASSSTTRELPAKNVIGNYIVGRKMLWIDLLWIDKPRSVTSYHWERTPYHVESGCLRVTMSSETSAVTYTSVYTDSEPGRAFWGADDEEISEGGIPRVIVLGYDGLPLQPVAPPSPDYIPGPEDPQTPPVPQDEEEREHMIVQAHGLDYVPEPIYPEYMPLEDDHWLTGDDIPESEQPPRKRLCLSTLGSRYEAGESYTARPIWGRRIDYGFVSTVDAEARRLGISEVGYGIRDTWVDPAEAVPEIAPTTLGEVSTRVTKLAELHERDTQDMYALLEDAQDGRTRISQRVTMDSQRVDLLMGDRMTLQETIWIVEEEAYASQEAWSYSIRLSQAVHHELQTHRDHVYAHETYIQAHQAQLQLQSTLIQTQYQVHKTRSQIQQIEMAELRDTDRRRKAQMAELLALRGQQRARQPGPDTRIPDHQDASRDADSHI
ncbi:hypothetical protein Tco_0309599 [Tanacetum coccineum]